MPINPYRAERTAKNEPAAFATSLIQQSLSAKQRIVNDVIAGRMEFLDAAARFQAAHSATAACLASATGVPVVVADNESVCRTLIGWVHLTLRSHRPEEADRVSDRLERELQGHLECDGKVNLPATPAH